MDTGATAGMDTEVTVTRVLTTRPMATATRPTDTTNQTTCGSSCVRTIIGTMAAGLTARRGIATGGNQPRLRKSWLDSFQPAFFLSRCPARRQPRQTTGDYFEAEGTAVGEAGPCGGVNSFRKPSKTGLSSCRRFSCNSSRNARSILRRSWR